ncbi:hypothetical protein EU244_033805 [Rhodococcus qingshengii]|uniref:hypothetical protein n=1 Tax=Rhodococcus qingshengii TaxID=334542 RepID=UPI0010A68190|nr:hypothetical protein [Rhodococcus qingshengii]THJ69495.1 hypothetical protein EU244_21285 [Rhodococcus qingshengii]
MTTTHATQIATSVLAKVKLLDRGRISVTKETIRAWAECFDLAPDGVWPAEALEAVARHYSKPNPFPIFPGDVIDYCAKQPVHSSREHALFFLDQWMKYPYSTVVKDYTGMDFPRIDVPEGLTMQEESKFLEERHREWVRLNLDALLAGIASRKFNPPAIER